MSKEEKLEKIVAKIKNLVQNKNKTKEELLAIAKKQYSENLIELDDLVTNPQEKKQAKKLLDKYLEAYDIEAPAEVNSLKTLIHLEGVVLPKLRKRLADDTTPKFFPLKIMEAMHEVIDQIGALKSTLNLGKKDEKKDPLVVLDTLRKRFEKYIQENRNDFTMKCPHCLKFVLLRHRTKDYIAGKHPFLLHNVLYNEPLLEAVVNKQITRELAAKIMFSSPDFIDWVIKKYYLPNREKNAGETN